MEICKEGIGCKCNGEDVLMIYFNVCLHFQWFIFYFDKSELMFKLFECLFAFTYTHTKKNPLYVRCN